MLTHHLPNGPHPVVAQVARSMLNKADNELSGVVSTATSCLDLFRDPLVARATSTSDFRIADLMNLDHPVSLYLVVPPSDLSRLRRLIRLDPQPGRAAADRAHGIRSGSRRPRSTLSRGAPRGHGATGAGQTRLASPSPNKGYRHRLLLLIDEFTSLGKLDFFENQLAFCAGYGLKCFMVAQSLNQLQKTYGEKNSILDNSHIRVTYAANDEMTARRISDLVGQATLTKRQKSFSAAKFLAGRSVSESEQEFARPLLTADEVLRLPFDEAILLVSGMAPYRARSSCTTSIRGSAPGLACLRRTARASSGRSSRDATRAPCRSGRHSSHRGACSATLRPLRPPTSPLPLAGSRR